jgi:phosphomannomutase
MPGLSAALAAQVDAWIKADPDQDDRARLAETLAAARAGDPAALTELTEAFAGPLAFGTAGLRGRLGPGPGRMNRAVVIRAAAGLMAYLNGVIGQEAVNSDGTDAAGRPAPPKVVIGYDARHGSRAFALDTAAVVVAAGGQALLWERNCPTPLLAYAVRQLTADAGVMVTASHNPARDNGYKVYLGGRPAAGPGRGVQIVPPADAEIAAGIAAAPPACQVPRAETGWETIGADLERQYIEQAMAGLPPTRGAADLRIVHTAMHGVGARIALPALAAAGFSDVHQVEEQAEPDPDFPTVAFPNPEEQGAIDLAKALAGHVGADLVIAQDPDADRCALAVFDPHAGDGSWRMLTGDEVGSLLGEAAATAWQGSAETPDAVPPTLACSVVSSQLLSRVAHDHGLRYQSTLTGFKWIARTPGLVFGYEEAIGYCTRPDMVRDKDGITAGLAAARLAAEAKADHKSLIDLLDDLARRHGLHATSQVALRFDDASKLGEVMRQLRAAAPQAIGSFPVGQTINLAEGWNGLPPTDALIFALTDGSRVVVRPSGTEPKVKCYLEVILPVPSGASFDELTAIRRQAATQLEALGAATRATLTGTGAV